MTDDRRQRIIDLLRQLAASTQDQVIRQEIDGLIGEIDSLGGDVISVGDISGSTGVAIGRNIEMAINQYAFPEELVEPLRALLDELKPTVFLSYARQDDEAFVERLYLDLVDRGFKVWWDRRDMPSRGNTFLQEIADAIAAADRLIAVCGPSYTESEVCRAELDHAHKTCTIIMPILRLGDYDIIPPDIAMLHAPDFRESRDYDEALEELLRVLSEEVPQPGGLRGVPSLPAHHLPRPDDLSRLSELVLSDARSTVVSSAKQTATLQGMGGVGKSVLAAAFARGCETRRAFPDNIFWLTIGQQPTDATLLGHMRLIGEAFGDLSSHYLKLNEAKGHLSKALEDKAALLILDDVWDVRHAEDFQNALGPRCRMLVTTRDGGLATSLGAEPYRLDVLSEEAALTLLAKWSGRVELPEVAAQVADEVGNLPFALALCGAMVRDGTPWGDLLEALQEADLSFIEAQFPNYPYPDVLRALKVSIDTLSKEASRHYHELAVFPEDAAVPEETIVMLWVHTNGLNARKARKLLTELDRKALLTAEGEAPNRQVRLHDLNHDYLRAALEGADTLHEELLAAYAEKCTNGWPTGPDDGYFFQRLARHLIAAGHEKELRALLLDFDWLQAKLDATLETDNLIADFDYIPDDVPLQFVKDALIVSAAVLLRERDQLQVQLFARLLSEKHEEIRAFLKKIDSSPAPHLLPVSQTLYPADGTLIRTLNAGAVGSLTMQGDNIILRSRHGPLSVWNWRTGEKLHEFDQPMTALSGGSVCVQGDYAICGSGPLKVWNWKTGELVRSLGEDTERMVCVAVEGDTAIGGYDLLKVWNWKTGELTHVLEGHSGVYCVALQGDTAFSGAEDGLLKVWDLNTGDLICALEGHARCVRSVRVQGDYAISASEDTTLKVWDWRRGELERTLEGHTDDVRSVSVQGDYALSGSVDSTLKVWNWKTGELVRTLRGHTSQIRSVELQGAFAVSGSAGDFGSLKVWRNWQTPETVHFEEGHPGPVNSLSLQAGNAISASREEIIVWDWDSGQKLRSIRTRAPWMRTEMPEEWARTVVAPLAKGASPGVVKMVVHDRYAVTLDNEDDLIRPPLTVWDWRTGKKVKHLERGLMQNGRALFPRRVALFGNHVILVFDRPPPPSIVIISYEHGDLDVDQAGDADLYEPNKFLQVWNWRTDDLVRTLDAHTDAVNCIDMDDTHAVSGSNDNSVILWDWVKGELVHRMTGHDTAVVSVSMDDTHVVAGSEDGRFLVWSLRTGELKGSFEIGEAMHYSVKIQGNTVLVADGSLNIWNWRTGKCMATFVEDEPLTEIAITPGFERLICAGYSGHVHFLRPNATLRRLIQGEEETS